MNEVLILLINFIMFRTVKLIAEEAEDMWHAYNLISVGDLLRSTTIRRVVNESAGIFYI